MGYNIADQNAWVDTCDDSGFQSPVDVLRSSTFYEAVPGLTYTNDGMDLETDISNDGSTGININETV